MKIDILLEKLKNAGYFADKVIGYALAGAMDTNLPLLVEGDPGVGKSSLALALADAMGYPLIRLQCYEGITPESILYDYDYQKQLLVVSAVRDKLNKAMSGMTVDESIHYVGQEVRFFGKEFLLERPVLKALTMPGRKILLIDEIDKASEEIEHTLLEVLSDFAISIPEMGETIKCKEEDMPVVVLTSNQYRDLSEPLKRRCMYLYIRQKTRDEIHEILKLKVCSDDAFCGKIASYLYQISRLDLEHPTSISEGIAWAKFLLLSLDVRTSEAIRESAPHTIGFLAKDRTDMKMILQSVFRK